ncbi:MAG: PAS domain-containing sensor histidine kinase [bacterium]
MTENIINDRIKTLEEENNLLKNELAAYKKSQSPNLDDNIKFRKIFDSSPDAIILLDTTGLIVDANDKVCDWLGIPHHQLIKSDASGLPIFTLKTKKNLFAKIEEHKMGISIRPFEIEVFTQNHLILIGLTNIATIFSEKKEPINYIVHISDITEMKAAQKALLESEEKFKIVSESSGDIIYRLRYETMEYDYLNPAFQKITGYTLKEINKIKFPSIVKQVETIDDYSLEQMRNRRIERNIDEYNADYLIKDKAGNLKWLRDHSNPWYNETGKIIGSIGILADITNRKKLEEDQKKYVEELALSRDMVEQHAYELVELNLKLEDSEEKLKELNASKDKFFSIIAHDLRSPFTTLIGYTEIIEEDFENFSREELKESIHTIYNTSKKIFSLLENLLSWARIQTGRMPFNPTSIKLFEVCTEIISLFEENAKAKSIFLNSMVKRDILVFADSNMIDTVIRNLVSNALKFTPQNGSITISAIQKENFIEVSIIDTGNGIKETNLNKLFKIDEHVTTLGTNDEKGSGLGLILCKELVETNGGKIFVESTLNVGSRFYFTLPVPVVQHQ